MAKFKDGDRVRTKSGSSYCKKGETGTVREDNTRWPYVHFDEWNSHRCGDVDLDIPYGHCSSINENNLELIPSQSSRAYLESEIEGLKAYTAKLQAELAALPASLSGCGVVRMVRMVRIVG